jgi:hypothetical protein
MLRAFSAQVPFDVRYRSALAAVSSNTLILALHFRVSISTFEYLPNLIVFQFDRYRRPSSAESNPASPSDPSSPTRMPTYSDPSVSAPTIDSQDHDRPKAKLKTKTFDGTAADDREDAMELGKGWTDKGSVPSWLEGW